MAFSGWGDAANAATGAVEYLMRGYDGGRLLAEISCDEYLDFTQRRPIVSMVEGGTRHVTWPDTAAYGIELEGQRRDLVVVLGEEPHLAWRRFAATVIELLRVARGQPGGDAGRLHRTGGAHPPGSRGRGDGGPEHNWSVTG